jgi:hypothetical protein
VAPGHPEARAPRALIGTEPIRAIPDSHWEGVGLRFVNFMEDGRLCPATPGALALSAGQGRGGRVHGHHVGPAMARKDMVPPVVRDGFPLPLHPGPRQG